jgi:cell division septal protein FtsQ
VLLAIVAAAAALAGLWWVITGPAIGVGSVSVRGYDRPDAKALEQTLSIVAQGSTMIDPRTELLRTAASRFPWVEDIHVSRDLPRGLVIRVEQAAPAAIGVPRHGPKVTLSPSGRVLGVAKAPYPPVPRVRLGAVDLSTGQKVVGAPLQAALAFSAVLDPDDARRVMSLRQRGSAIIGTLQDGPELRLGLAEDFELKARSLDVVLGQLSPDDERSATYLDLSVPSRPAVGSK